jgi:hypothetical protein
MLLECYLSKKARRESRGHLPINPAEARAGVGITDGLVGYSQASKGNLHYHSNINKPNTFFCQPYLVEVFFTTE